MDRRKLLGAGIAAPLTLLAGTAQADKPYLKPLLPGEPLKRADLQVGVGGPYPFTGLGPRLEQEAPLRDWFRREIVEPGHLVHYFLGSFLTLNPFERENSITWRLAYEGLLKGSLVDRMGCVGHEHLRFSMVGGDRKDASYRLGCLEIRFWDDRDHTELLRLRVEHPTEWALDNWLESQWDHGYVYGERSLPDSSPGYAWGVLDPGHTYQSEAPCPWSRHGEKLADALLGPLPWEAPVAILG